MLFQDANGSLALSEFCGYSLELWVVQGIHTCSGYFNIHAQAWRTLKKVETQLKGKIWKVISWHHHDRHKILNLLYRLWSPPSPKWAQTLVQVHSLQTMERSRRNSGYSVDGSTIHCVEMNFRDVESHRGGLQSCFYNFQWTCQNCTNSTSTSAKKQDHHIFNCKASELCENTFH